MSASLEARVPYADHVLVEKAFRLPHHFKIDVCPNEKTTLAGVMGVGQARQSQNQKGIARSRLSLDAKAIGPASQNELSNSRCFVG